MRKINRHLRSRSFVFSVGLLLLISLALSQAYAIPIKTITLRSVTFDREAYSPGDNGTAQLLILNEHPSIGFRILEAGIQFDWLIAANLWFRIVPDEEIKALTAKTYTIPFFVPSNITVGDHSYEAVYVGAFEDWNSLGTGFIDIRDPNESVALALKSQTEALLTEVSRAVSNARESTSKLQLQTTEGLSSLNKANELLEKADSELNRASILFESGNLAFQHQMYDQAKSNYSMASSLLDAVKGTAAEAIRLTEEARTVDKQASRLVREQQTAFASGLAVAIIALTLGAYIILRKSRD